MQKIHVGLYKELFREQFLKEKHFLSVKNILKI